MNRIQKRPLADLGYNFIDASFLKKDENEYHLRNQQLGNATTYRKLTDYEIEALVRNDNTSDDWNNFFVAEAFDPQLVKRCHFFGMIRIGKLEAYYLEFHNLRLPVGLYNSTICSCDFGDNVVVHNVNFLSHYIIGNEVILFNVNEMATTDYAKFGNGIVKEGESEQVRIWMELCNENGGRSILPFDGMLPGDAYLWTRNREDHVLMDRFKSFTEKKFDAQRGYYGMVGDRSVIKNCKIIKDVTIGTDAYLKGANKLKNLTINSSTEAASQIGEGCELVNGIVGYGCKIFYGVKAVRFVMASHSQLKYGARLINSYLGNNATISCCEVLNSLIFPSHEQHHNNSFLIAALIMGQSNMAAGATIGSNHNSRGADGEIITGRGFWPGLSVTLKHNSRFASFTIISKGNYMSELNIPFPFSLIVTDEHENQLNIMPGYWFMHNMYALARNSWKYIDRDKRTDKTQYIEYDYLAPDAVEEMIHSLALMEIAVGKAWYKKEGVAHSADYKEKGKYLLTHATEEVAQLTIYAEGLENSKRKVKLLKVHKAYGLFKEMIVLYGLRNVLKFIEENKIKNFEQLVPVIAISKRSAWHNIGGQLIDEHEWQQMKARIKNGTINSWDDVHSTYRTLSAQYPQQKLQHAIASMLHVLEITPYAFTAAHFKQALEQSFHTMQWVTDGIFQSRKKDYTNPFRKITFESEEEMDAVVGKLSDNGFIQQTVTELKVYQEAVAGIREM
jgi:Domain of unknown function (DUF4954)